MESVGFKEWAVVCEALGRGEQTIILRKGGIAEGREGFSFRHREFFLFPTFFHEQVDKVRSSVRELPSSAGGRIEVRFFARVEYAAAVTSLAKAMALQRFHILEPEVVQERFEYDAARGVHVAFVRVYRLLPPWSFRDERRYGGCRSWVQLPNAPADTQFEPVLDDRQHAARVADFRDLVAGEAVTAA